MPIFTDILLLLLKCAPFNVSTDVYLSTCGICFVKLQYQIVITSFSHPIYQYGSTYKPCFWDSIFAKLLITICHSDM